ncbi:MAG TPA: PilZ domain-containing protein [Candidatus Acidoferrum sp.]|nr:PilZ domain-containing protein [Candidatus Acidoferrum sp.]
MKTESSPSTQAKNSQSGHSAGATSARPFGPAVVPDRSKAKEPVVLQQDRRRVQRVMLRVPVTIHAALQGKETTLEASTFSVSNAGALLIMKRGLPADCRFVLEHSQTKERIVCRVTRAPREMPEGSHVSVEFDSPAPNFWRIAFPPADWRPVE